MQTYKIAVVAGDGIGPEVISEGVKVLDAVASLDGGFKFEFTYFPWGCAIMSSISSSEMIECDDGADQSEAIWLNF